MALGVGPGDARYEPERPESAIAWELRTEWALGREVALSLTRRPPVRGYVEHVAPSGAFILLWDGLGQLHVPVGLVAAIYRPHFHEAGWGPRVEPRAESLPRRVVQLPNQLAFDFDA